MKLNETSYAIEIEGNQFTAIKYGVSKVGKPTETALGYFHKLSGAALRLCREEIASSMDVVTLKEFAQRVEETNEQLERQLEAVGV